MTFAMINIILIILLFTFFCWILYLTNRRHEINFSSKEIVAILGSRVILGSIYGYIYSRYFNGDDTWYFHNGSIEEYEKLIKNPIQFFADLNPIPAFERNDSFAKGWYYYLSDLEFWLITKPMAIFNIITGGNYYVNIVCFNFLVCWGSIWLFRFWYNAYPSKKALLFFLVFILPVPLFWMTGIRAEGWILFFLAGGLISFERLLKSWQPKFLAWLVLSLIGILILRSVLLLILIPVLFAWWLQVKRNWKPAVAISTVLVLSLVVFFGTILVNPQKNLPALVVKRQQEFFSLHGQTRIGLDSLHQSPISFIQVFPQAVGNSFLRPFIWEAKGLLQYLASFNSMFLLFLLILFWWRPDSLKKIPFRDPRILYPAIFGILLFLFIGYTVPFPGAIIRYKSIGDWFLIIPLFMSINWKK